MHLSLDSKQTQEPVATVSNWDKVIWHTPLIDIPVGTKLFKSQPNDKVEIAKLITERDKLQSALTAQSMEYAHLLCTLESYESKFKAMKADDDYE